MSFNINSGYPLARIKGGKSTNGKIIRIDDKNKSTELFNDLNLPDEYEFIPIPNFDAERTTLYCCGMAGSGKSYFVSMWLKEYRKFYKDNPIYIFSEKAEDKQLDEIKGTHRVKLSDELEEIDYLEFSNSCCVFDDIDSLEKPIRKLVNSIRDKCLKLGRSANISVVCTNHSATDGLDTKTLLNESMMICFFMQNWNRSLKYLVENYLGMTKEDVKKAKKSGSRWTCYIKQSYPNVIIQKHNMWIAGKESE
jgi:hypothetical protein